MVIRDETKKLILEAEEAHGRQIDIWQDQGGVTIVLGLHDRNLTIVQASIVIAALSIARDRALGWQRAQEAAGDEH